ncbi:transmembrane transport protein [Alcanivorax balearicus MACL04]|uniref:Transmembrane transport protein n=2 Tax=Alloalcanivorax balearicus TaxID=413232 RepID=A0ABT2R2E9_9GAMM|nr:transmembrane transport protein [Alloalcanivorax balearicus MACL04]
MAVGLFTLASGFSASYFGYAGHFLLAALLACAMALLALAWRPPLGPGVTGRYTGAPDHS